MGASPMQFERSGRSEKCCYRSRTHGRGAQATLKTTSQHGQCKAGIRSFWRTIFLSIVTLFTCVAPSRAQSPLTIRWSPETLRTVHDPGRSFYCYAPSVVTDGDDGCEHVFAC